MVARILKNMIYEQLRAKTAAYRKLVVDFLNLVFGHTIESMNFWDTTIRKHLQSKYCYLRAEDDLKMVLFLNDNSDNPPTAAKLPNGLYLTFMRFLEMTKMKITTNFLNQFAKNPVKVLARKNFFHETDLVAIGVATKQLNIIDFAQGFVYSSRGDAYLKANDMESAKYFYDLAIEKYEEALHANPYNKWTLVNLAEVLAHKLRMEDDWKSKHQSNRILAVNRINKWYVRALTLDARDTYTLFSYARFSEEHNDNVNPEEFYLRSLESDASFFLCVQEYANFLTKRKHPDREVWNDLVTLYQRELKI